MKENKVAILGGSFDPIHLGHLFLLHYAISMTDYNHFIIIPAKVSNFKQDSRPKASDENRIEMIKLALLDYQDLYPNDKDIKIEVSDLEIIRGGVSYTSDTVKFLKEKMNINSRIGLIMGDDHVQSLTFWHEFDYLKDNVEFLICKRDYDETFKNFLPKDIVYQTLLPKESAPQSSSLIRANLKNSYQDLPRRVCDYVKKQNLYS